ncbi:CFC_HP_G0057220.mRNA.1.CDS.1 [Saccharomyces cerevisiae]|nr:CFC_HP_G0057220.mRNA.1.CDS.1 [Saccharomyces cerevisiae]CAI6540723.1 CFC_HP_G0057220.mRNA.1.CDS.1 [Saccharomyces cerevisiae]
MSRTPAAGLENTLFQLNWHHGWICRIKGTNRRHDEAGVSITQVCKGMDKVTREYMNLQQITMIMDKFEQQFEIWTHQ